MARTLRALPLALRLDAPVQLSQLRPVQPVVCGEHDVAPKYRRIKARAQPGRPLGRLDVVPNCEEALLAELRNVDVVCLALRLAGLDLQQAALQQQLLHRRFAPVPLQHGQHSDVRRHVLQRKPEACGGSNSEFRTTSEVPGMYAQP